ncbi:MAG: glycosyltransferase family 2 protein [Armatimonadota bacterium]
MVSALIPAFNAAATIGRALDSVYAQTYDGPIEIIVVDDGSTDATAEIVRDRFPKVTLIRQENCGPAAARNRAAAVASGEFLAMLDADDQWLPEKTQRQLTVLTQEPSIGAVATNGTVVASERRYPWMHTGGPRLRELSVRELLLGHRLPIGPSTVCRTQVFHALGGYDRDIRCGEDLDLFCRIVATGLRFVALNEPLYTYTRGEGTITGRGVIEHARDILRVVEKMDPRVDHEGYRSPLTLREFSNILGERILCLAWAHLARGEHEQAHAYMRRLHDLPASGPVLRALARLAQGNRLVFQAIFTFERRLRHLEHFVRRWGLVGATRHYLSGRSS